MSEQVYVIFAVEDLNAYLKKSERKSLAKICNKILVHREMDGKVPNPAYIITEVEQSNTTGFKEAQDEGGF